jgi:hypothetical protein
MRKSFLFAVSAAVLTLASWSVSLPANAQGLVPGSTTTAPGATAKGIKDSGVKGCGSCGLTGGRVKRNDGTKPAGKANDWVVTMPTKRWF